jgi:hypothetical protein
MLSSISSAPGARLPVLSIAFRAPSTLRIVSIPNELVCEVPGCAYGGSHSCLGLPERPTPPTPTENNLKTLLQAMMTTVV